MTSLAQRMQIASAFVVFHRKHVNDKTLTSLTIGWQEDLDVHLANSGNAAKALAFAVPALDKPTVELSSTSADAVHVYLHGAYAGLKVKATSIARRRRRAAPRDRRLDRAQASAVRGRLPQAGRAAGDRTMTTPDPTNAGFPYAPINEPAWGIPHDEQTALLRAPLAGIELGTYDERILTWIVDTCDTPTVAVIASLLHRARSAQPLDADAETVTIARTEFERLNGDSAFLETLFAHGVDNWEGYADAHADHEDGKP